MSVKKNWEKNKWYRITLYINLKEFYVGKTA